MSIIARTCFFIKLGLTGYRTKPNEVKFTQLMAQIS